MGEGFGHDWSRVKSFDSAVQKSLTKFVFERRQDFEQATILSQSILIRTAVSMANIVLRGLISLSKEETELDGMIQDAIITKGLRSESELMGRASGT